MLHCTGFSREAPPRTWPFVQVERLMSGRVPVGGGEENMGCGDDVRTVTPYWFLLLSAENLAAH